MWTTYSRLPATKNNRTAINAVDYGTADQNARNSHTFTFDIAIDMVD